MSLSFANMDFLDNQLNEFDLEPKMHNIQDMSNSLTPLSFADSDAFGKRSRNQINTSNYSPRFPHRGRFERRRRARNRLFNHFTPYYDQQFPPYSLNNYWGARKNCHHDQCGYFSPRKNKVEAEFSCDPINYSKEMENFCRHEYPSKYAECESSFKRQNQEKTTQPNPIHENARVNYTPLRSLEPLYEERQKCWNDRRSKTLGPKKRKRGNSKYFLEPHLSEIISFNQDKMLENSTSNSITIFAPENELLNENSAIISKTSECHEQQKLQGQVSNEAALAVQNLQLNYLDIAEEMFVPHQGGNNSTKELFDQKQNLNSDDAYTLLNSIISEMGQNEKIEKGEMLENNQPYKMQTQNDQLLTFPQNESIRDEIVPENQFASLIQQNQILTDLLCKIINNSDIVKPNIPPLNETKHFNVNQAGSVQNIENEVDNNTIADITLFYYPENTKENLDECSVVSTDKETNPEVPLESINNSSTHFDSPVKGILNLESLRNEGVDYQMNTLNTSHNSTSSLDFMNFEGFSGTKSAINSLTNHNLSELPSTPKSQSLKKLIENADETKNEKHSEKVFRGESEIKTVVEKETVSQLSTSKSSIIENKKEVIEKSVIEKKKEPKSPGEEARCMCDHGMKLKSAVDEQTQTPGAEKTSRAVGTEDLGCARNRRLRTTTKEKARENVSRRLNTQRAKSKGHKCEIQMEKIDVGVEVIKTKLLLNTQQRTPFTGEQPEHEKCRADESCEVVEGKWLCSKDTLRERKYDMRRRC